MSNIEQIRIKFGKSIEVYKKHLCEQFNSILQILQRFIRFRRKHLYGGVGEIMDRS